MGFLSKKVRERFVFLVLLGAIATSSWHSRTYFEVYPAVVAPGFLWGGENIAKLKQIRDSTPPLNTQDWKRTNYDRILRCEGLGLNELNIFDALRKTVPLHHKQAGILAAKVKEALQLDTPVPSFILPLLQKMALDHCSVQGLKSADLILRSDRQEQRIRILELRNGT